MKKRIALFLVFALILISVAACTPKKVEEPEVPIVDEKPPIEEVGEYPVEITDDFGNMVKFEKAPDTIISLAPNNTEILFALGLGDKVVGVTSFCDYPEEALAVEKIGDFNGINLEKIIELNPDLVLNYGPGDVDDNARLKEAGIQMLAFLPESIDAVINTINTIGQATGSTEQSKELTNNMMAKKNEILVLVKGADKKKVFYEIWHDPLMAAGPGSFMDQLITLAGGTNIAENAEGDYAQYDLEQLIERNPEVYLTTADMPDKTPESMMARPGFENIEAMKTGNVHVLDANITSRSGPRVVEALELVAKAIHPELFK
jgi:iron complex transport system substrate-binding protein